MKKNRILKFGGTSVATKESWQYIVTCLRLSLNEGVKPIVVCSAPASISDLLEQLIQVSIQGNTAKSLSIFEKIKSCYLSLADALTVDLTQEFEREFIALNQLRLGIALVQEASPRVRAQMMSYGELLLTRLGYAYLRKEGISVALKDVRDWLMTAQDMDVNEESAYLSGHCYITPNVNTIKSVERCKEAVIITQGFIAKQPNGDTVLLGRGGSDTSAAYLAVLLQADRCEIWTDVPGMYTANPQEIPEARFIHSLNYDEAQEIAAMGGKVLHPNCIGPLKAHHIPLHIRLTTNPKRVGTVISSVADMSHVPIKSILKRTGLTLITIETVKMWRQVGFLARIFNCFKEQGISIDLVSTSESNVTVSLDPSEPLSAKAINRLVEVMSNFAEIHVMTECASISLVGKNIRMILHKLGDIFSLFKEKKIYLLSQAANDLNLTFVVDEEQSTRLVQKLHALLIEQTATTYYLKESWQAEFGEETEQPQQWWESQREVLLDLAHQQAPLYVYNGSVIKESIAALKRCHHLNRIFYSMKANPHPLILKACYDSGIGIECVSLEEVEWVLKTIPDIKPQSILFTPNFAPIAEYKKALLKGIAVTIDNLYLLETWPQVFREAAILIRVDILHGQGHHKYVVTGGGESKFGIPIDNLKRVKEIAHQHRIQVVGLHAHAGSGILDPKAWEKTAKALVQVLHYFDDVKCINVGGGLGIVEKNDQEPLDLQVLNDSLGFVKTTFPELEIWMEPGRFLVGAAGVLLATVTQLKQKGQVQFIGLNTGMNSLMRPALYGSYHKIVNLSRLFDKKVLQANIVGPICESADILGYARLMPQTNPGDVLLIANTGAYGHSMSSSYNLRDPAKETVIF